MRDIILVVIVVILQFCHLVKGCLAFVIFVIESGEIVIFVIRRFCHLVKGWEKSIIFVSLYCVCHFCH